jgi:tRNA wybutosine-synthesizing protein 2
LKTPLDDIKAICKEELLFSDSVLDLLPLKWELLGDVLILKLNPKIKEHWEEIARIYAETLKAKAVLRRYDKIRGVYRKPGVELLFGDPNNTETLHKENKILFKFDPLKIMFSSGNIDERIRISKMANQKDIVVDMFSGIGYFAIPIAVHSKPERVYACELNPIAYHYLCENIDLNKVAHIVESIHGDNRNSIPQQIADRIIMGYIKCDITHLEVAFKVLKPWGGTIHFHNVSFKDQVVENSFKIVQDSLVQTEYNKIFKAELASYYKIKSFGPKLVHVVLDIEFHRI